MFCCLGYVLVIGTAPVAWECKAALGFIAIFWGRIGVGAWEEGLLNGKNRLLRKN